LDLANPFREAICIAGKRYGQYFESDIALQLRVACLIHLAHAASPKRGNDLIRSESTLREEPEVAAVVYLTTVTYAGAIFCHGHRPEMGGNNAIAGEEFLVAFKIPRQTIRLVAASLQHGNRLQRRAWL
jgi:hypothetical protein